MRKKWIAALAALLVLGIAPAGAWQVARGQMGQKASEEVQAAGKTSAQDAEGTAEEEDPQTLGQAIGILLPGNADDARWAKDLEVLREGFSKAGYMVRTMFAGGDSSVQSSQLAYLAKRKAAAIVIVPVEDGALDEGLAQAEEAGIGIYSYDVLLMDTPVINYFLSFDWRHAGKDMGNALAKRYSLSDRLKALENTEEDLPEMTPLSIEFFFTDKTREGLFYFNGMMESLQAYFEAGLLSCPSGRSSFLSAVSSEGEEIEERFEGLLSGRRLPDMVVTGDASIALSLSNYLLEHGYSARGEEWPCITALGADVDLIRALSDGRIASSILWEQESLAKSCVKTVTAILAGQDAPKSNFSQYDNGVRLVKTVLTSGMFFDKSDMEKLFKEGYFSRSEVFPSRRFATAPKAP